MTTRRITDVDRMLLFEDRLTGETKKSRRRTVRRFGQLEVVVVEETDKPTKLYLCNFDRESRLMGRCEIVEVTMNELEQAAAAVRELLANPPPIKRRAR